MTPLPRPRNAAAIAAISLASLGTGALAADPLKGEALRSFMSDRTIQGSMTESGRYTEFYAADGTIRGQGYTGTWRVDGDRVCFDYNTDPEDCWTAAGAGDQVEWIKDGKTLGTGTAVPGNVNNY